MGTETPKTRPKSKFNGYPTFPYSDKIAPAPIRDYTLKSLYRRGFNEKASCGLGAIFAMKIQVQVTEFVR